MLYHISTRKTRKERDGISGSESGTCAVCNSQSRKKIKCESIVELGSVPKTVLTTVKEVKSCRVEWRRGCGNPNIHTGKSNSLSPPDKSPLDKCGQAGKEPSFSSDGVQDSDKDEALLGEMGEQSKGPQAEKLSQQQCSFQLLLAKPLKKFTHRHSPYSANIGYSTHVVMCLKCNCACVHIWLHILLLQECGRWVWSRNSWSGDREEDRGNEWDRERETVFVMFIFRAGLVKNTPWNLLFHRKWQTEHHELIPWWRSGSLCSHFLLCASACPDTG